MSLLFAIFIIFLLLLFIFPMLGVSILRALLRALFGTSGNKDTQQGPTYHSSTRSPEKRKKIIDKNEGEYVDFEEVKDDEDNVPM
ncbi:MAG: DUF4834 family protein [Candidatus Azobacteroides sp.]|nr:DUF4834 family protein [Candidatus Azobacteroides sp.]